MTTRGKFILIGSIAAGVLVTGLVVIFVVGFLLISRGHQTVSKATCGANLKVLGNTSAIYASQYGDRLPGDRVAGGTWICDQPREPWDVMGGMYVSMSAVPPKTSFEAINYCPANGRQDASVMWGGPGAASRVSGYVWTNARPGMPAIPSPSPRGDLPPLGYHARFSEPRTPSHCELAADWIISDTPAGTTWTGITAPGRPGTYDTSHLAGSKPQGGNALMYDGHVEWQAFNASAAVPLPQSPAGATFWFAGRVP